MIKREITEKGIIEKETEGVTSGTETDQTETRTPVKAKGRDRVRDKDRGQIKGTTHTNRVVEIVVVEVLVRVTQELMEDM